jgi:hypothetical protein
MAAVPDSEAPSTQVRRCLDCGAPAPGRFCPDCGQATDTAPRPLLALLRAALTGGIGRKGRITRTLLKLLFAPGGMTADFLAGRRARYLRPLQLYFAVSVIVFAAVQLLDLDLALRVKGNDGIHLLHSARVPEAELPVRGWWAPPELIARTVHTPAVERFARMTSAEKVSFLRARRARLLSSVLLVLVPAFAATLAACFRRSHRFFVEHLVFALHAQAFALLAVLVESALPAVAANIVTWWTVGYFLLAMRRVYGTSWPETLVRGSATLAAYVALFYLANLLLVLLLISS